MTDLKQKLYAKIYCEEGVIHERKFNTKAEAKAFVDGFFATIEAIDSDDDFHLACVDDEPSKDEP